MPPKAKAKAKAKAKREKPPIKAALSAYNIFTQAKQQELRGRVPSDKIFKEIADLWREATPREKEHFQDLANQDKLRYDRELEQWLRGQGAVTAVQARRSSAAAVSESDESSSSSAHSNFDEPSAKARKQTKSSSRAWPRDPDSDEPAKARRQPKSTSSAWLSDPDSDEPPAKARKQPKSTSRAWPLDSDSDERPAKALTTVWAWPLDSDSDEPPAKARKVPKVKPAARSPTPSPKRQRTFSDEPPAKARKVTKVKPAATSPKRQLRRDSDSDEPPAKKAAKTPRTPKPAPKRDDAGPPGFRTEELQRESDAFHKAETWFKRSLQGTNPDYVHKRIMAHEKPIKFSVKAVTRIHNPPLQAAFAKKKAEFQAAGIEARERVSFHSTHPRNVDSIVRNSLLPFGHPRNPCKEQVDSGWFGSNRKGVYVSTYPEYTFKYANGMCPLKPGDECSVILFRTLPGKCRTITKKQLNLDPTPGYNSHASANDIEWYLFEPEQLCPEYILRIVAFEDKRAVTDDGASD